MRLINCVVFFLFFVKKNIQMRISEIQTKLGKEPGETMISILERNKVVEVLPLASPQVLDTTVVYGDSKKEAKKQYHVQSHEVFSRTKRQDKLVKAKDDKGVENMKIISVNRIGVAIQKKIVNTSVSFLFGNPVSVSANTENDGQVAILAALKKVFSKNRIDTFNRAAAKDLFRSCEIAEIWFTIKEKEKNTYYGFPSDWRIKVKLASNWLGDELYPLFDENQEMIAFGRRYTENNDQVFEIYTSDEIVRMKKTNDSTDWKQDAKIENQFKKIPVNYAVQENVEWADVESSICRLEMVMSNFADTNDYHASPKIFIKGKLEGFSQKGETGSILQGGIDSDMKYVTWENAPHSVKTEIENLYEIIYSMTQTPNLSFENLKKLSIGNVSGKTLEFLFLDSQLKVMEKREIFDAYLDRRNSIVLSILTSINPAFKKEVDNMEIQASIVPFTILDKAAELEFLQKANGGKKVLSQKSSVLLANITSDPEEEYELILAEEKEEAEAAAKVAAEAAKAASSKKKEESVIEEK